ncbi:MAG: hypothetical protein HRU29_11505 [Rhizobiales bacterium]|nr:hypothetical protein [Hyphomicrobiales bacterium]NRB15015.1 hypothetical protein [Hyphomicrobiales bacterium]
MTKVAKIAALGFGTWSIGKSDGGTATFQDLGQQLGLNLNRVGKDIKGRHVASEFGFGTLFSSWPQNKHIVDDKRGDTIKIVAGTKKITAIVDQISIHKAGGHARIMISEKSIRGI